VPIGVARSDLTAFQSLSPGSEKAPVSLAWTLYACAGNFPRRAADNVGYRKRMAHGNESPPCPKCQRPMSLYMRARGTESLLLCLQCWIALETVKDDAAKA
jgi:hypothetical protein